MIPAQLTDAPLLMNLILQGFEQYRDKLDPPSGVFVYETAENITEKLKKGGGFITYDGDTPTGAVLYEFQDDSIYLGRLAVLPAYRGQGVAKALVAAVEQVTHQREIKRIWVMVRIALTGNQEMFERLGYHTYENGYHPGYTHPTFVKMQKFLAD